MCNYIKLCSDYGDKPIDGLMIATGFVIVFLLILTFKGK
ncbi:hypothetical protein MIF8_35 [Erwinia phage MIF8]